MKSITLGIFCIILILSVKAQNKNTITPPLKPAINSTVIMGTGIISFMQNKPEYYQFIAPRLSLRLTERFSVNAGLLATTGNYHHYEQKANSSTSFLNFAFIGIGYNVTEKLTLSGTVLYQPVIGNYGNQRRVIYSAGAEYKVNKALKVGLEIRHSQNAQSNGIPYNPYSPIGTGF